MWVALPGRVMKIEDDNTALVDFNGNSVEASLGLINVEEGDRVLVHAGCVIQVIDSAEADNMEELFNEISEWAGDL
jgi:hydrogenase expression/formation protein HypC